MKWPWQRRANPSAALSARVTERNDFRYDGPGYQGTQLGAGSDDIDLTDTERNRAVEKSRALYRQSPAYGAVCDRFMDHVIGDGVSIQCEDEAVQTWLDSQLERPENKWSVLIQQRLRRMIVEGELTWAISTEVRDPDGMTNTGNVYLGRWPSTSIAGLKVHEFNHDAIREIAYRTPGGDLVPFPVAEPGSDLVRLTDDANLPKEDDPAEPGDRLVGVQLWRAATLGLRSGPFFTRILDKGSSLDDSLEQLVRKAEYLNRFWLHITYQKANDEQLGEGKSKDLAFQKQAIEWATKMEPGAAMVTGQDVTVEAVTPDLKLVDMQALYDVMLDWILGSHGIPRMWFSSGGDTNRATAAEQGSPIYRSVTGYQAYVQTLIEDLIRFILYLGERARVPGVSRDSEFTVAMSDVATRDSLRDADEVGRVILFLNEAVLAGIITEDERRSIGRALLGGKHFGEYLDDDAEAEAEIEGEGTDDDIEAGSSNGQATDELERDLASTLPVHRMQ